MNLDTIKNKSKLFKTAADTSTALACFFAGFILAFSVFGGKGYAWHLVLCAVMPLMWLRCKSRLQAWLLSVGYYLGAARDVIACSVMFYGLQSPVLSLLFWLASSLILTVPWTVFWTDFDRLPEETPIGFKRYLNSRAARLTLALLFVTIPPFGIGGWTSPIMGYAWFPFFTGLGFVGIALGIALTVFAAKILAQNRTGLKSVVCRALVFMFFLTLFIFGHAPDIQIMNDMAEIYIGFKGIFTQETQNFSEGSAAENTTAFKKYLKNNVKIEKGDKVIILPETAIGVIDEEKEKIIRDYIKASGNKDVIIAAGAVKPTEDKLFDNGLYFISLSEETRAYTQRFPTPFSMWFPWHEERSFTAHWFDTGVMKIAGHKAVLMICPEYLFAFPVLYSFASALFDRPEMIIAINDNKAWPKTVTIPQLMDQHLLSWARLFGVPVIKAENR